MEWSSNAKTSLKMVAYTLRYGHYKGVTAYRPGAKVKGAVEKMRSGEVYPTWGPILGPSQCCALSVHTHTYACAVHSNEEKEFWDVS